MRLGPIAVPVAIVAALFVIVGAEAGWFDGTSSDPSFVHGDGAPQRVATAPVPAKPTPAARPAPNSGPSISSAVDHAGRSAADDAPAIGRSIGRNSGTVVPGAGLGSGGAGLDADGIASVGPQELLRQAREEAAKAKQDVVDVTRASIDAQHASEAEAARQLGEANERNAALAVELEQARSAAADAKLQVAAPGAADPDELRRQATRAEAASKAATDDLARARATEAALRAELVGLRIAGERKVAAAAIADKSAAEAVAAHDVALAAERGKADNLSAEVAAQRVRAASLRLALAVQADRAARARANGAEAMRREAALGREIADMRSTATAEADRAGAAADTAARSAAGKVAATDEALARSQGAVHDLQARLAALNAEVATGRSVVAPAGSNDAVTRLKGDLDGARRGEDTLRKENGMLQRQLAEARASGKLLGEKLAALQVGAGQAKPEPLVPRATRGRRPSVEHQRLLNELSSLQRKQMQGEIDTLRFEADSLGKPHARRFQPIPGARVTTVDPTTDSASNAGRGRDGHAARGRDAARIASTPRAGVPARAAHGDADDAGTTIAQARAMIRNGQLDQARHMLSQHGGPDATRALADSYNPLTNTDYGAIGVDSDADKAAYLYQQAARQGARTR